MSVDETLILTILVSGSGLDDVPKPVLPDMQGLIVVGSTASSSSSFDLINGALSSSQSVRFIYQLKPHKAGVFVIDPIEFTNGGVTQKTFPITIEVLQNTVGVTPPSNSRTAPSLSPSVSPGQPRPEDAVYIRTSIDKNRAYVGEQVTVTYTLYTRIGLTNARYEDVPSYTGFWMEELFSASHLDFIEEIISGRRIAISELRKIALFPTVTGVMKIEPLGMICDVRVERSRKNFFDSFLNDPFDRFFPNTKQIKVMSDEETITVLPLPVEGRPVGFSNAVGDFSLETRVDRAITEVNQPITLKIELSGEGNMKTVEDPVLPPIDHFKEYQSGRQATYNSESQYISGTKTWDHVLIPTLPGDYTIDSLDFPYFNPESNKYQIAKTEPIAIKVLATAAAIPSAVSTPRKTVIRQLRRDIQYIKSESVFLGDQGEILLRSTWYLLLHALPVVLIVGTFIYRSYAHRLQTDAGYARWRRARNNALIGLKQSRYKLDQGALDQAFAGISNALYGYVADKFNLPVAGLTSHRITELLEERGVDNETIGLLKDCLAACDMARFAPTSLTEEHTADVLDRIRSGIGSIEQQITK